MKIYLIMPQQNLWYKPLLYRLSSIKTRVWSDKHTPWCRVHCQQIPIMQIYPDVIQKLLNKMVGRKISTINLMIRHVEKSNFVVLNYIPTLKLLGNDLYWLDESECQISDIAFDVDLPDFGVGEINPQFDYLLQQIHTPRLISGRNLNRITAEQANKENAAPIGSLSTRP